MNRILKPTIFLAASIYFLVDAVFMTVASLFLNGLHRAGYSNGFMPGLSRCAPIPRFSCLLCL